MTQLSIQKALVDDRRRHLAAQRHGSEWPVRLEARRPTQTENRRWRAFSLLVVAFFSRRIRRHGPARCLERLQDGAGYRRHLEGS
jgi:hypothetical protein